MTRLQLALAPILLLSLAGCNGDAGATSGGASGDDSTGSSGGTTMSTSSDDPSTTAPGDDTTTNASNATTDVTTTGMPSTDSGSGEGSDSSGGGPEVGVCTQSCTMDAECCPPGAIGCPGDYPNNWTCENDVCVFGGCTSDDDCTGLLPGSSQECHDVDGVGVCVDLCSRDADCEDLLAPDLECGGTADDGETYCTPPPDPCESDDDCGDFGVCDTDAGTCGCSVDDECAGEDLVCDVPA